MNATNSLPDNWQVYLLLCADGSLYCGICKNPARRLLAHQQGKASRYTRSRGIIALRVIHQNLSHSQALQTEYRIKQQSRAAKLKLWHASTLEHRPCHTVYSG